jgi:ribosomal protein S18 acetylase RimI-like enzyme
MVAAPGTHLLVARLAGEGDGPSAGPIVGTLTLVVFRIPTGVRAWIEDVVVDEGARGRGVGQALTRAAIDRAAQAGARTVDLTSRPAREAANRLYQGLGFQARATNVYRYSRD